MDKTDVVKVIHLLTERQVNAALDSGWRIIETAGGNDADDAYILYSLGWANPEPPPKLPSPYDDVMF